MPFNYLTNTPLEQANQTYMELLIRNGAKPDTERVPVPDSFGRTTAKAVYAHISAPHYPACAMDGIATRASLTDGASETTPVLLQLQDYVEVDTGDPLPDGCDTVIMVEDLIFRDGGAVELYSAAVPWQHIRQNGEDLCAGEMILASGMQISAAAIGALLAGGILEIEVIRRPVVGIIPTGDEIIEPVSDPAPGTILEFNSPVFSAMLTEWGAVPKRYPIVKDNRDAILSAVTDACDTCDLVLLNAGSSAGREDHSASVIEEIGGVLFHGIAIKPGKPAILGHRGSVPVVGVPGYPVSGIIVLEQIVKPVVDYLLGRESIPPATVKAKLSRRIVSGLKYEEFVRVQLGFVNGEPVAIPLARGAGIISSFMKADGILTIPQKVEGIDAGASVDIRLLRSEDTLRHALVAIGSHDPLLDELGDLLHLSDPHLSMSSSHVGSMGGIMAVRRGETHIAGCHLLDEKDGTYNTGFIEKYFPNGGVRLVECVGRKQGLMVAAGNPLSLRSFRDITRDGIRFVNRQKGSGTRILNDYLCRKNSLNPDTVYGYEREEYTHTAVAAQIAADTADCGMGIYSAAKMYHLDFLPVCVEQYDLLIPDTVWNTKEVQSLIRILQSDVFRARAEALGGYTRDNPGRVRRHFQEGASHAGRI